MQTGPNLGLGCLLPQAASRPAGLCGPTLLEGGDKNTLGTPCVPSPCYVLGRQQGSKQLRFLLSWNVYSQGEGHSTSSSTNTNCDGCSEEADRLGGGLSVDKAAGIDLCDV